MDLEEPPVNIDVAEDDITVTSLGELLKLRDLGYFVKYCRSKALLYSVLGNVFISGWIYHSFVPFLLWYSVSLLRGHWSGFPVYSILYLDYSILQWYCSVEPRCSKRLFFLLYVIVVFVYCLHDDTLRLDHVSLLACFADATNPLLGYPE